MFFHCDQQDSLWCFIWGKPSGVKAGLNSTFKEWRSWHPIPLFHGKLMGKHWKQWQALFSWAPKSLQMVTAAMQLKDACSLEAMTNLDSRLKSRDITLLTKVHLVKAIVFPVVMYGSESWTIKKADAFELWCWRRLLRVPWTARRSNQSILKEIRPEYSPEVNSLDAQAEAPIH